MTSHNNHNLRNSKRQKSIAVWPFVVLALLLLTGFFVIKAINSQRAAKSDSNPPAEAAMSASTDITVHYPNLEIAKYTRDNDGVNTILKNYEGFTVSFNPANHTPDWAGWELLNSETSGEFSRNNKFWQDDSLTGCPTSADYSNSGYDRGHLCPAADQKWSEKAMKDCFVMANMCPQDHALNAGAWQTLEKKERIWAQRDSALVIVAGPIYSDTDTKRIGDAGVRIPSAFFKVILAPYIENPRAIGFIFPNMTSPGNMENYSMTVDEVESVTGFDFFSSLPDEIENKVESAKSFTEWNR